MCGPKGPVPVECPCSGGGSGRGEAVPRGTRLPQRADPRGGRGVPVRLSEAVRPRLSQLLGGRRHLGAGALPRGPAWGLSASSVSPGVFLPPAPAAANEPVLEEVGIVALAPLADMLSSPQPSPVAAPIVSPLTGPLNVLLPCPGPVSQSSPLTNLLTGPLSSHLASPVAVSPAGTLASSLGLPSTGPLTPSSPLAGPTAVSLSSPLLTSTAAPPGVSQNLLANPMSNLVLSEPPRVRLAEPLQGCPSGPHPSAAGGPAATSKGNQCGGGAAGRGGGSCLVLSPLSAPLPWHQSHSPLSNPSQPRSRSPSA